MIVDGPILADLTLGSGRRIPQPEDSQVVVPPVLSPVVLAIQPTKTNWNNVDTINQSLLESQFVTRTNQAAAVSPIAILAAGLWELELLLSTWFNYVGAAGSTDEVTVTLFTFDDGISTPIMSRFAVTGSYTDFQRGRYLVRGPMQIDLQVPLTGAGESLNARAMLNAIKIL